MWVRRGPSCAETFQTPNCSGGSRRPAVPEDNTRTRLQPAWNWSSMLPSPACSMTRSRPASLVDSGPPCGSSRMDRGPRQRTASARFDGSMPSSKQLPNPTRRHEGRPAQRGQRVANAPRQRRSDHARRLYGGNLIPTTDRVPVSRRRYVRGTRSCALRARFRTHRRR